MYQISHNKKNKMADIKEEWKEQFDDLDVVSS